MQFGIILCFINDNIWKANYKLLWLWCRSNISHIHKASLLVIKLSQTIKAALATIGNFSFSYSFVIPFKGSYLIRQRWILAIRQRTCVRSECHYWVLPFACLLYFNIVNKFGLSISASFTIGLFTSFTAQIPKWSTTYCMIKLSIVNTSTIGKVSLSSTAFPVFLF